MAFNNIRNWLYWAVIIAATFVLLLKVADRVARQAGPLPNPPAPNAYEELLRVAEKLNKFEKEPSEMTREETVDMAKAEGPLLEPVHSLVRTNSAVPLKTTAKWGDQHEAEIKKLKRLAVALALQARSQELAGNTNLSARTLVDLIGLGHLMARGGIYVDGINSLVIEALGAGTLRPKVRFLDSATSRWAARELESLEDRRESPDLILEREKTWSHASFGLVSRVGGLLRGPADAERQTKFLDRYHQSIRRTRRLVLALGAQAYELENKRPPAKPGDLVPGILKAVPVDPVTKEAFRELPQLDAGL